MSVSVRPRTKFAAALLAAGVVSAASVTSMPEHRVLPTISVDVDNASAITDAVYGFGQGVGVLSSLVGIHVDAAISLPFEATLAVMAAAQHPELAPNVLSYLVQRFVNPAVGPPIAAYPWETEQTFAVIASLLPYPLGPSATESGLVNEARRAFADAFNSVLGQLPDPLPGLAAVNDVKHNTVLGRSLFAGQLAVRAPLYMVWNTVDYLGTLPANLEAAFESAIQTPNQIPGLISYLVHGLLSPDPEVGLLGKLLNNVVDPFTWLPGPVGSTSAASVGVANQIRNVIAGVMTGLLSLFPTPVRPSALPSTDVAQTQTNSLPTSQNSFVPDSLPSASLAVVDGMALTPVKLDEKSGDTTASKIQTSLTPEADDLAATTPETPGTDAGVTSPDAGAADGAADNSADAPASEADASDSSDKSGHEDGRDGDAKVRPGKVKQGKDRMIKDHRTRPSTRDRQTKPGKAEPGEAEAGGVSGGPTGTQGAGASQSGDSKPGQSGSGESSTSSGEAA
jgi:hypothetical protein